MHLGFERNKEEVIECLSDLSENDYEAYRIPIGRSRSSMIQPGDTCIEIYGIPKDFWHFGSCCHNK